MDELESLRQEIAAWCIARPDPSALSIAAAYEELAHLDTKEQSLLPIIDQDPAHGLGWLLVRHVKRDQVLRGFAPRRQLLRARALELSRGGLRPLKLTDIPLEILRLVFDAILDDDNTEGRAWSLRVGWDTCRIDGDRTRRRDIGTLRLVCRLFSELATPLLFPILSVQLSQASLDLAEKISQNPAMAAGVRGIRVYLGYRPREYAYSPVRYLDMRLATLTQLEHWYGSCQRPRGEKPGKEREEEEEEATLRRALEKCARIRRAWRQYVHSAPGGGEGAKHEGLSDDQEIFQRGYTEFCRRQNEQRRLLQHGTFADALASAVARMPNARSVAFFGNRDGTGIDYHDLDAPLLSNDEMLYQFMVSPLRWQDIDKENTAGPPADLKCARLLWELPIALHRAGAVLADLRIGNLPMYNGFSALHAQNPDTRTSAWDELAAACQNLEVFDLSVSSFKGIRRHHLPHKDKSHIDNFLGAILSRCGPRLRHLSLDFFGLSINTGTPGSFFEGSYHSDPFLRRLQDMSRLRGLTLSHVELRRDTLSSFCDNLGGELVELSMLAVTLHGGGWADAVDTLRGKLAAACARGRGSCSLDALQGGEFMAAERPTTGNGNEGDLDEGELNRGENELLDAIEKYVEGRVAHNPLRA
jgi:hypothetical protein